MKQKNNVQKKLDKLQRELDGRKDDQKDILLERMRDRDHTEIYDEMLESCEKDIERISQQINDIRNYHETIKKRKEEMKQRRKSQDADR
ncbi:MAG: hypothetical protein J1E85_10045 [Ruminococcus sp.]|nr:hypothetical protein [Ruminococcus sp.]